MVVLPLSYCSYSTNQTSSQRSPNSRYRYHRMKVRTVLLNVAYRSNIQKHNSHQLRKVTTAVVGRRWECTFDNRHVAICWPLYYRLPDNPGTLLSSASNRTTRVVIYASLINEHETRCRTIRANVIGSLLHGLKLLWSSPICTIDFIGFYIRDDH